MSSLLSALGTSWAVVASDPRALAAASIAALSLLGFVATYLPWPRRATAAERSQGMTPMVMRLASSGAGPAEIARRTRLSHDAVATILRRHVLDGRAAENAAPVRPVPAGFARRWHRA